MILAVLLHFPVLVMDLKLDSVDFSFQRPLFPVHRGELFLQRLHRAFSHLGKLLVQAGELFFLSAFFLHIGKELQIGFRRVRKGLQPKQTGGLLCLFPPLFQRFLQAGKLFRQLLLPSFHALFSDEGPFRILLRIQTAQLKVLIEQAVRGHAHPALAELLDGFTFDHISQQKIHIVFHIFFPALHLFGEGAGTGRKVLFGEFSRIRQGHMGKAGGIQTFVSLHRLGRESGLHQGQLVPAEVAFQGVSPFFIPDIQKVGKNTHRHIFSRAFVQTLLNLDPGLLQRFRIGLLSHLQLF